MLIDSIHIGVARCMKKMMFFIVAVFSVHAFAAGRVVPEAVLNSWGYKTVKIEKSHRIKKIKRVEGFYPRFMLSKQCFGSDGMAREENKKILKQIKSDPFEGQKTYRDIIVNQGCLYDVRTDANLFYLVYQPFVVKKLNEYVAQQSKR